MEEAAGRGVPCAFFCWSGVSPGAPQCTGAGAGAGGAPNPASVLLSLGFTRLALQYLKETRTVEQDGP